MNKLTRKTFMISIVLLATTVLTPIGILSTFAEQTTELTKADCEKIVAAAEARANKEKSALRVPSGEATTKMHIACVNRDGTILVFRSMPDAWAGSIDIARAKANTARAFSSNENAISSRSIGCLSQPGGPLWMIGNSNQAPPVQGDAETSGKVGGLIQFPGGLQAPEGLRKAAPFFMDTEIDNPGPGGDDGDPCTIGK